MIFKSLNIYIKLNYLISFYLLLNINYNLFLKIYKEFY